MGTRIRDIAKVYFDADENGKCSFEWRKRKSDADIKVKAAYVAVRAALFVAQILSGDAPDVPCD